MTQRSPKRVARGFFTGPVNARRSCQCRGTDRRQRTITSIAAPSPVAAPAGAFLLHLKDSVSSVKTDSHDPPPSELSTDVPHVGFVYSY